MKPAPFRYEKPRSVEQALALLAAEGEEPKVLAGGQSLVPLMNFRLARPSLLVDINGLAELSYIRREGSRLRIGALTRHAVLEESPLVERHWPLLTEAVRLVGHPQIRNAGTIGGSLAHADPTAELPVALAALDAGFVVRSRSGARELHWSEFFVGQLQTSLQPDELLVETVVPALPAGTGCRFDEFTRRHGDFALGGCAVTVSLDPDGACTRAAIALLGAAPTPIRAARAEAELVGRPVTAESAARSAAQAVQDLDPTSDLHASGEYRRDLIESLVARSLLTARDRAREGVPA
ncbi:FAD binding domain-containing protein [Pseudonocardia sp. H11422]|uniref:FAD binding domain-containing protein n=1 Tax=Pseudonocardia sp. H11422 TaxID=2835866 RepID=UPI001BDCF65D|nr:xanthine dehydrogenase family protein subunit M [Pseudonocardia sp. H11422]